MILPMDIIPKVVVELTTRSEDDDTINKITVIHIYPWALKDNSQT